MNIKHEIAVYSFNKIFTRLNKDIGKVYLIQTSSGILTIDFIININDAVNNNDCTIVQRHFAELLSGKIQHQNVKTG